MDVMNIGDPGSDGNRKICLVGDEITNALPQISSQLTIYVIVKKEMKIEPFLLMYIDKQKDVRRIDPELVRSNALPMWGEDDKRGEDPDPNRQLDDALRIDFYRSNSGISYAWTDIYETKDGVKPSAVRVRCLEKTALQDRMSLYMFIPTNSKNILVLSEQAYGAYLRLGGKDYPSNLECQIMSERAENAWIVYQDCGHMACHSCHLKHEKKIPPECMFIHCPQKSSEPLRVKIRHGPCPIDGCLKVTEKGGVILYPCGCYIQCNALLDAVKHHKQDMAPLLRDIPICPYDMCAQKVTNLQWGNDL